MRGITRSKAKWGGAKVDRGEGQQNKRGKVGWGGRKEKGCAALDVNGDRQWARL